MQRLFNIGKWFEVGMGKAVHFGNPLPRKMRVDVNAPQPTALYYADGNGEITFLALVTGRDVLEFQSDGEFSITVDDDKLVNMYTIDGEDISFRIPDAVKLTKVAERRARNPEIEFMQYQMNRNIEARLSAIRSDMERALGEQLAAATAAATKPQASSSGDTVSIEPEPPGASDLGSVDKPADGGTGKST